jgi:AcrR family transcriptional regulator
VKENPLLFKIIDPKPRKGDLRKQEILQATIAIVGKEGAEALSFESIGQRLKIRRSHVAYHFQSLEEIVLMATRYAVAIGQENTIRHMTGAHGLKGMIEAMVDAVVDWISRERAAAKLYFYSFLRSGWDAKHRELHAEIREAGAKRMVAGLQLLPEVRSTPEALFAAARNIQGLLTGLAMDLLAMDDESAATVRRERRRVIEAVETLLKPQLRKER